MSEATRQGFTKVINWGQALHLEAVVADGGLKAAVDRIHSVLGTSYGTRNTYKALFAFDDVPTTAKHRERAYLLLISLGQDPTDWGLGDVEFPAGISLKLLSDLGERATGWLSRDLAAA